MTQFNLSLKDLDEKLYSINRVVSINIAFEKDIKKQKLLMEINRLIAETIKKCREGYE